jgi:hypothetical protein
MGPYRHVPGGATLALVMGLSLCAIGCDKKDEDTDEETDEDVSEPSKGSKKDSDDPNPPDDPATGEPESPDNPTPTPTSPTAPPKITLDAGTKPDGGPIKDAGASAKPSNQACLQKCASLMGQCAVTAGKDGGPFALPDLAKCQTAAEACRKACGH